MIPFNGVWVTSLYWCVHIFDIGGVLVGGVLIVVDLEVVEAKLSLEVMIAFCMCVTMFNNYHG